MQVAGRTARLTDEAARALRDELTRALGRRREFVRTAGEHRADGSYVVSRRGANSAGHRKVFETRAALVELFAALPREFTAEDVGRSGLSGGRRHMVLRHLAEHPDFDCELVSRQPLTACKHHERSADERDAAEHALAGTEVDGSTAD